MEKIIKVQPVGNRLIVKKIVHDDVSVTGIMMYPESKEKATEAVVIRIYDDYIDENGKNISCKIKNGQKVVISEYMGTSFEYEGNKYYILKEADILAIFE